MRKEIPLLLVLTFLLGLVGIGCNGGSSTPAMTITLQASGTQSLNEGQTLTITATVNNDPSNKGVTWSLSGPGSLSNRTATNVDYVAPATVSSAATATVTATTVADTSVTAHLTLTVNPVLAVSISTTSLPNGTVGAPYSIELTASGGVLPYSWSISTGSLPSWASLDAGSGVISGTPEATGTTSFTVKVTDSQSTPASATQALSIVVTAPDTAKNAELSGQYAFLLQGFDDATGKQFAIAGSFIADGNGNVTKGIEDLNGPDGYKPVVSLTGTYNVGADNRGFATLTSSLGTTKFAIALGSLNSSNVATRGSLIEFDDTDGTTGKRGSGFFYLQNSQSFTLSGIKGPYAFQFIGQTGQVGTRWALTGAFTADGTGNVTNGEADGNKNGNLSNYSSFTATISTDGNTGTFGRVRITPTGVPLNYVCYIVSANRALTMSSDNESTAGLLGGEVLAQSSTPFSATSLNGTAVGYGVGDLTTSLGLWNFDGSATASFSLAWSANFIFSAPETGTLSYVVEPNGRVTTAGTSVAAGVPGAPILYLVDNNKGFLMSTDFVVSAGFLEPQTGGPFSNSSLSGNYFFGTVSPAAINSTMASGVGTSTGDGTLNLTTDESTTGGFPLIHGLSAVVSVTVSSSGLVSNNEPWLFDLAVGFVVSNKKVVAMLNNGPSPTIAIFQQ